MNQYGRQPVGRNRISVKQLDLKWLLIALNLILLAYNLQEATVTYRTRSCILIINTKDSEERVNREGNESIGQNEAKLYDHKPVNRIADHMLESVGQRWQGSVETRGNYSVLRNFFPADSDRPPTIITMTTQGTHEFLYHGERQCGRWDGPVSIGVYAPGDDFAIAVDIIHFMRECAHPCVRLNVSWHLVYDTQYGPTAEQIKDPREYRSANGYDCDKYDAKSYGETFNGKNFRRDRRLIYPINVLRNVARLTATTDHVLPTDIELYPSGGLVDAFVDLLDRERRGLLPEITKYERRVYVLPVFEVDSSVDAPLTKAELHQHMVANKAVFFHASFCGHCQLFPDKEKWFDQIPDDRTLNAFLVLPKRLDRWEPIYISNNQEPLYNERLSWEGKQDKMLQGWELCAIGYAFVILDNAFLVHTPGIKYKADEKAVNRQRRQYIELNKQVYNEEIEVLKSKYGTQIDC